MCCLIVVSRVVVFEEHLLSDEVSGECDGGDAEAREGALEAVEAGEGPCVSPLLTVQT